MLHASFLQLHLKYSVGILEATVTVEQRLCIRIRQECLFKGIKHQFVVVSLTYYPGDNGTVI